MAQPKYQDRDWLYEQYVSKERPLTDIADQLGCDHTTISKWRRRLGIPKPTKSVELECPVCGTVFTRFRAKVERAKHASVCSRECHYEGRSLGIIGRKVEGGYDVSPALREKECVNCGDEFTVQQTNKDQRHCSRDCFLEMHSERMVGDGNPAYIDGSSYDKRCHRGPHWEHERVLVYERDDYTCRRCGEKCIPRRAYDGENGKRIIQAHHVEAYESPDDNSLDNLLTLCASCHGKVEGGAPLDVDGYPEPEDSTG